MTIFVIFRTAFRTRCIIRSRMRIVFLLAAVGICGAAYAPPVVCGPILRSSRAPSGSMYSDGRDPASPHNTQQLAATAKLQNLLRKGAQGDECVLPCDEVQCDKKGLIILLRHGESKWNAEDRFTGWHDVPLSAQGEDQAVEAAQALQAAGLDRCIDVVYASALKRTIKTAWLVLETLDDYTVPIEQAWQLNERMYGLLTGLNKKATRDYLGDELFEELRRDPPPLDRGSCYDPASAIAVRRTTIVEATSGNTGIGLAMVAAAKGYKMIVVMPQVPSMFERYILVRKFGGQVHLTSVMKDDFRKTIDNMIQYSKDLCEKNQNYWSPTQFETDDNPLAHLTTTGPEIWEQTGESIDCFVAGAGTGGTLNGVGQFLKEKNPSCRVVCVEPTEARVLVGNPSAMHGVVGIGANIKLPLIEKLAPGQAWKEGPRGCIDEFLHASTPEAVMWANRVSAEEGLLVGPSSGAAIKVGIDIAKRPEMKGKTIVILQASSAIRYVSHPMWEPQRLEGAAALPVPPDLETEIPIVRWRSESYMPPPKSS